MADESLERREEQPVVIAALSALAGLFLCCIALNTFVDPDIFHEMALFREALALGYLPLADQFAYTPTVYPSVHHEWGAGAILYFVSTTGGAAGLLALKYLLCAGIAIVVVGCARLKGASYAVLCPLIPIGILLSLIGFTTVRAQMFTLLALACLLYFLEQDRRFVGLRASGCGLQDQMLEPVAWRLKPVWRWRLWIGAWLAVYVLWVNVHGGFVVGLVVVALYTAEQIFRKRPVGHLIATIIAMAALIMVNPYGWHYYPYIWDALWLERPLIPEWRPLWHAWGPVLGFYVFSLVLVVYAVARRGVRQLPGLVIVLLTAYAALRHQRHLSLYAVVWVCCVPAFLQETPLARLLQQVWITRRRACIWSWGVMATVLFGALVVHNPLRLRLPANRGDHPKLVYPVGAVSYLREVSFRGNLMTPFTTGAFVTWKLFPSVKVSMDGRFEVAYPPGGLAENHAFYQAEVGWRETLNKYPTDMVLIATNVPLVEAMSHTESWQRVYADDAFELYAPLSRDWAHVDNRGQRFEGDFP